MSGPFDRAVLWLTWRQLFARKRIYLAAAFSLLPLVFTVFFKFTSGDAPGSRLDFFGGMSRELIIGTLVPLAAALFGTTAFGGEVDDGTLVYCSSSRFRAGAWCSRSTSSPSCPRSA